MTLQPHNNHNPPPPLPKPTPHTHFPPLRQTRPYHLSLLRALLRECTYLPDPTSRSYYHSYILTRYRKYIPSPHPYHLISNKNNCDAERIGNVTRNAKKGLSLLRRANKGEIKALEKVLMETYGRRGRRRRGLLGGVVGVEGVDDRDSLEEVIESRRQQQQQLENEGLDSESGDKEKGMKKKQGHKMPPLNPKLLALIKSQAQTHPPEYTRPRIRNSKIGGTVPEMDIWLRKLSQRREEGLKRRWYVSTLDRLLPPLPDSEFEMLRDLVNGRRGWVRGGVRRRRGRVLVGGRWVEDGGDLVGEGYKGEDGEDGDGDGDDEDGDGDGEDGLEVGFLNQKIQEKVFCHPSRNRRELPHFITRRFMRRLWAKVLSQCPRMTWESEKNRWEVEWGNINSAMADSGPMIKVAEGGLFEGVDSKGRVLEVAEREGMGSGWSGGRNSTDGIGSVGMERNSGSLEGRERVG
ncbi:MAG: hypothetical protein M1812_005865 [Candelaria pacifica]|nr:MAG: hypothetical protein M1812_005865 [Candelaria pacifica]